MKGSCWQALLCEKLFDQECKQQQLLPVKVSLLQSALRLACSASMSTTGHPAEWQLRSG
jgi:hypothetical protein